MGLEKLPDISFSFKDVTTGLGDLTFYSTLATMVFLNLGVIQCFSAIIRIMIGSHLALRMLKRRGVFLGLHARFFQSS